MSESPDSDLPSVAAVAADIAGVIGRFTHGETHAFAFGDGGVPEAVIASYDQYDDLGGDDTLGKYRTVVAPEVLGRQLPEMVEAIRRGTFGPPVPQRQVPGEQREPRDRAAFDGQKPLSGSRPLSETAFGSRAGSSGGKQAGKQAGRQTDPQQGK